MGPILAGLKLRYDQVFEARVIDRPINCLSFNFQPKRFTGAGVMANLPRHVKLAIVMDHPEQARFEASLNIGHNSYQSGPILMKIET